MPCWLHFKGSISLKLQALIPFPRLVFRLILDNSLDEDMALFQALGNEDPGSESFEEMFAKMASMKGMCKCYYSLLL